MHSLNKFHNLYSLALKFGNFLKTVRIRYYTIWLHLEKQQANSNFNVVNFGETLKMLQVDVYQLSSACEIYLK